MFSSSFQPQQPPQAPSNFCGRCGTANVNACHFCTKCGNNLMIMLPQPPQLQQQQQQIWQHQQQQQLSNGTVAAALPLPMPPPLPQQQPAAVPVTASFSSISSSSSSFLASPRSPINMVSPASSSSSSSSCVVDIENALTQQSLQFVAQYVPHLPAAPSSSCSSLSSSSSSSSSTATTPSPSLYGQLQHLLLSNCLRELVLPHASTSFPIDLCLDYYCYANNNNNVTRYHAATATDLAASASTALFHQKSSRQLTAAQGGGNPVLAGLMKLCGSDVCGGPVGLAVDDDSVYVANLGSGGRGQIVVFNKFTQNGEVRRTIDLETTSPYALTLHEYMHNGKEKKKLLISTQVYAAGGNGEHPNCICVHDAATGKLMYKFGKAGSGNGEFDIIGYVAVNSVNNLLYVTDTNNHRVQIFDLSRNGAYVAQFGTKGIGSLYEFDRPTGIAFNDRYMFIADTNFNNRIVVYEKTPASLDVNSGKIHHAYVTILGVDDSKVLARCPSRVMATSSL